jgi:uncharacterized BrkB/YihY/UPF0761 family membrane protein
MNEKTKEIFKYSLAGLIVITILTLVAFLIFKPMPEPNRSIIEIIIGALVAAFTTVISFFFGSSKGSEDKTKMIYNSTPTANDTPVQPDPTSPPR